MTSSGDELFAEDADAAVDVNRLRVIRGGRPALHADLWAQFAELARAGTTLLVT